MYLTKQSYEAKKKELEDQKKASGGGADKLGDAFGELFKGMFGGMMSSSSKSAVQMYIKDPEKRVISLEFQDAQGKPLKTQSRWSSGEFQQTEFASAPPADTQLTIQLAVPEAVKTFPVRIARHPAALRSEARGAVNTSAHDKLRKHRRARRGNIDWAET